MSKQTLFRSVALGLALASASISHGAVAKTERQRQVAAHMAALRQKLTMSTDLNELIRMPNHHDAKLETLHSYQTRFGKGATGITIGASKEFSIETRNDGIYVVPQKGETRRAEPADLVKVGITGKAEFSAAVNQQLHVLAGMKEAAASEANALRLLQTKIQTADELVPTLMSHDDVALLRRHNRQVVEARTGSEQAIVIGGNAQGDHLVIAAHGIHHITRNTITSEIGYEDLVQYNIASNKDIKAMLGRCIMTAANVHGDASDPKVVARARKKLTTQLNDVRLLDALITQPESEQITFIQEAAAAMAPQSSGEPRYARIAQLKDGEALELRPINFNQTEIMEITLVNAAGQSQHRATVADLHRFKIDSPADFRAAVDNAVLNVASEDLPL